MEASNPTISEIETWAWSFNDKDWPHSEWPLYLSWTGEIELFIELASNHKCPKKDFFLFMLYNMVGIAYEYPLKSKSVAKNDVKFLISKGRGISHGDIRLWVERSEDLMKRKITYTYDDWRGGVLANYKFT